MAIDSFLSHARPTHRRCAAVLYVRFPLGALQSLPDAFSGGGCPPGITPFAQSEMVQCICAGANPAFKQP
jgi:hypothetical protein